MSAATPLHPVGARPPHPLLPLLACPQCRKRLLLEADHLRCECGNRYPIVRGVPRFVADDAYVSSFSFEWNTHRRTQLDSERGDDMSMSTFQGKTGLTEADLRGKLVLDAGVGTGRFTEVMTRLGARVIGVDLSLAVEAAYDNLGGRDDVLIAQGDIGNLPFAPGTFDYIVSIGVLHHTPDTRKHFHALVPLLKAGGTICIWVYPDEGDFKARNHWIPFTNKIPSRMFYEWCRWLVPFVQRREGTRLQALIARIFGYSRQPYGQENDILDTFDGFSPRYHGTHSPEEVAGWFREAGLVDVREPSGVHTSMRGTRVSSSDAGAPAQHRAKTTWTLPGRAAVALVLLGALCVLTAFLLRSHRGGGDLQTWTRHGIEDFVPELGHAFTAALPKGAPDFDRGPVAAVLLEDGKPVGTAAEHDLIRRKAGGRFSFWHGTLYFSASDGSDPRTNGHRYEVAWPSALATVEYVSRKGGIGALGLGGACSLLALLRRWLGPGKSMQRRRRLVARLMLVPGSLLVLVAGFEGLLRWRYPFADNTWPCRFDPAFGFHFEPHATVRQTNLFDFCVEQQANSLGFLDREPVRELPPGTRRIVVLGDSFVEASQLPIAAKFHVVLEDRLRARQVPTAVSAFGMSGCGTSNELSFYEHFGSSLEPDLVIVLVVANDFANNSALLEAVRNGWHPEHPPRPFLCLDDGKTASLPIDPAWQDHVIPTSPVPAARPSRWSWSRAYRWTKSNIDWIERNSAQQAYDEYSERLAWLRRNPAWEAAFAGWRWPDDDDFDVMTFAVDAPPVFREAVLLTERALAALRDRVTAKGGRLLVVGCEHLPTAGSMHGRPTLPRAWLDLIEPMCGRLDLPFLDLHAFFAARGVLGKVTFVRDSHWNAIGHETAAAAIDDYLQRHADLLAGR